MRHLAGRFGDERPGNGDGQMGFARAGAADQDDVTLIGDKGSAGEIAFRAASGNDVGDQSSIGKL